MTILQLIDSAILHARTSKDVGINIIDQPLIFVSPKYILVRVPPLY